jgi:hypothetical protein
VLRLVLDMSTSPTAVIKDPNSTRLWRACSRI